MQICGAVGEGKVTLERHVNRKFMVNVFQVVKFRKTQLAAQGIWSTGNVYSTLVGKWF